MTSFKERCLDRAAAIGEGIDGIAIVAGSCAYPILLLCAFIDMSEPVFHTSATFNFAILFAQSFVLELGAIALVFNGLTANAQKRGQGTPSILAGGIITFLTVVSVACSILPTAFPMMAEFAGKADLVLLLVRCVMSVLYGFLLHVLRGHDGGVPLSPQQQQREDALTQQINGLSEMVNNLATSVHTLAETADKSVDTPVYTPAMDRLLDVVMSLAEKVERLQNETHVYTISEGVHSDGDTCVHPVHRTNGGNIDQQESGILSQNESANTIDGEINGIIDLTNYRKHASPVETEELKAVVVPTLDVPTVSQEQVHRVLTAYLVDGTPWRSISGNYSRTIRPIREAYERYMEGCTHDEEGCTQEHDGPVYSA